jgi:hypothetical protein
MKAIPFIALALLLLGLSAVFASPQRRGYRGYDDDEPVLMPPDADQKAEWTFARFHYNVGNLFGGFRGFQRWAADYPKSDRQFVMGVRRLTRLNARSVEQVVDAFSDDLYNWPWIYVEDPGGWRLSEEEAQRLHEYLLKGGFMFLDDSHGDFEWQNTTDGLHMIFPDRAVEDVPDDDVIFHITYDLSERFQIHGTRYIWGGRPYTPDSAVPQWRAIRDDKGRIMVAICHNSDVGDAWEWADSPRYPEREASLAYRIGINYIMYSMTH